MPAKKGEAKPASSSKKAAAPSKGVAKAAAKGTSKAAAKGTKGAVKSTQKAKATDSVKKVVAKKAAVAASKGAAKKGSKASTAKPAAPAAAAAPATKTIKKKVPKGKKPDTRTLADKIGKKKMLFLSARLEQRAKKNKLDVKRRQVVRELREAKLKANAAPKKTPAAKKTLTAEEKKALGPWKVINKRKVVPMQLRPSKRITSHGNVWTPHIFRKEKGFNPVKERKGKLNAIHRAVKAKNMIGGGARMRNLRKVWTKVHFRRPKTQRLPKNPQYPRRSIPRKQRLDQFSILKHPHTTETAMKKLDDENTLVFVVDMKANKHKIRAAVKKMYDIKPIQIRTVVTPLAVKKAFVRLHPDNDALDVANKIGMI